MIISKYDTNLKWVLLSLSVFGGFVFAYSYDTPSSVKDLLEQHFADLYSPADFEVRYSFLYSLMALPNVLMTVFLGYLIDRFKVRVNYWVMGLVICVGATVTFIGVRDSSFLIMYVGRFLLGSTGESIHIVEGLFLRQYFSPYHMSFIISIIESFLSLGGFVAFIVSPRLADQHLLVAFEVASFICFANALLIIIVCVLDKIFEMRHPQILTITPTAEEHEKILQTPQAVSRESSPAKETPQVKAHEEDDDDLHNISSDGHEAEEDHDERKKLVEGKEKDNDESIEIPHGELRKEKTHYLKQILSFPKTYWFTIAAGATALSTIQSFLVFGPSYIIDKGYFSSDLKHATIKAGEIVSLFRITAAITLPLFGYLVDLTDKRPLWLLIGVVLSFVNHILAIFVHPIACCVIYGCCYAIVATSLWPSLYIMIPKKSLGMATGIVNGLDNLGLMIYPAINGVIKSQTNSYDDSMLFLAALMFVASIFGYFAWANLKDDHEDHKDNRSVSRRSSYAIMEYNR